jgi:HEXXH motif-containing protein
VRVETPQGEDRIPFDGDHPALSRPYHPIVGDVVLALADNNPLSMFEAHPDKEGNAIDLGGKPVSAWTGALRDAFELVRAHLPELAAAQELYAAQIVPVGYHDERHLSASYQEAIGTVYMTLHPDPMTMTEALVHELAHNRLNAMLELDPLLENAFSPLFKSPVRPDPRPLHGVLLAVHAFLPVARLYERMREAKHPLADEPGFERRLRAIAEKNHEGASVILEHAVPTAAGRALLDEIRDLDARFAPYR